MLNNFKRFEIGSANIAPRLELIRRDLPLKYEFYVRSLAVYLRNARAKAVEPLFSDTIVPPSKKTGLLLKCHATFFKKSRFPSAALVAFLLLLPSHFNDCSTATGLYDQRPRSKLVRDAQDIDLRIDVLTKMIDRRFTALGIDRAVGRNR